MGLRLDHLVVCASRLGDGVAFVQDCLGVDMGTGGEHGQMGTHNRLLSLGPRAYLEVIAINPDAPPPDHRRWFDLDRFAGPPRLTSWVARCDDLEAAIRQAPVGISGIMALSRGDLRWRMAVAQNGRLPFDGVFPGLISWSGSAHPAARLKDRGCRLLDLQIVHPEAGALRRYLAPLPEPARVSAGELPRLRAEIQTDAGVKLLC